MQGLDKILEKISSDPANTMLIDRYIRLTADLSVEAEKADYIIRLAEVLVEVDPQLSMQYAYMVFQYDQLSIEALNIVAKCLKQLGRLAKAEVILNEIQKLESLKANKLAAEVNSKSVAATRFSMEVSKINVDGVEMLVGQHAQGLAADLEATQQLTVEEVNVLSNTAQPNNASPPVQSPSSSPIQQIGGANFADLNKDNQQPWTGPDLGVIFELFDLYFKHQLYEQAASLLNDLQSSAHMPWWQARMAMLNQVKKPSAPLTSAATHSETAQDESKIADQLQSDFSPPQELIALIEAKSYRKALLNIRQRAANGFGEDVAEYYFKTYCECAKAMKLPLFTWAKKDGADALIRKLLGQSPKKD